MPNRTFTGKASEPELLEEGEIVRQRQMAGRRQRWGFTLMIVIGLLIVGCWRF